MTYVDLLLPLPLQRLFTYEVPQSMESLVRRGGRALVQFGKKKYYAGIIMEVHGNKPSYETKSLCEIVDTEPIGEILDCGGEKQGCTIPEAARPTEGANPISHIRALLDREAIYISEELRDAYKPKKVKAYSLSREMRDEGDVCQAIETLEKRAPKQMEALMAFIQAAGGMGVATGGRRLTMDSAAGLKGYSAQLTELARKGYLAEERVEVSRLKYGAAPPTPPNELTEVQAEALAQTAKTYCIFCPR